MCSLHKVGRRRCPKGRLLRSLCVLLVIADEQITSLIRPIRHLPSQHADQAVRRREFLPHMSVSILGAFCTRAFTSGAIIPRIRSFQLPRCHSKVLLRCYLSGFTTKVSLVTMMERVGLSPVNEAALTASCLSPGATQFRHAQPLRPLRVTAHALIERRFRPATPVSGAYDIWPIQAHHLRQA